MYDDDDDNDWLYGDIAFDDWLYNDIAYADDRGALRAWLYHSCRSTARIGIAAWYQYIGRHGAKEWVCSAVACADWVFWVYDNLAFDDWVYDDNADRRTDRCDFVQAVWLHCFDD